MGKAGFVQADWIKPGAAVIDVGTNRVTDAAEAERLFRNFPARLEKFRAKGNALGGRCASGCRECGGGVDAGAGRRGADDDNDVDEQHGEGGADASREGDSADDFGGRAVAGSGVR